VWDARLTSELILLFFIFASWRSSGDRTILAARQAGAVLALVGVGQHPDHLLFGEWWNTLHQGASVSLTKAPTMAARC